MRQLVGNAVVACLLMSISVTTSAVTPPDMPSCVQEAADFHQVNPWILRGIIWQESGNRPQFVTRNTNGSVDVGQAGINSVHFAELAKFGIQPQHLLNGCVNTYVAAWHLARQMKVFGNTWNAVAAYHSRNAVEGMHYAQRIHFLLRSWGVITAKAP